MLWGGCRRNRSGQWHAGMGVGRHVPSFRGLARQAGGEGGSTKPACGGPSKAGGRLGEGGRHMDHPWNMHDRDRSVHHKATKVPLPVIHLYHNIRSVCVWGLGPWGPVGAWGSQCRLYIHWEA